MLTRPLILLVSLLSAFALTAAAAEAATVVAKPSIKGAGTLTDTAPSPAGLGRDCQAPAGASTETVTLCPKAPWLATDQLELLAVALPGWTFAGWSGCPQADGPLCTITAKESDVTLDVQAKFHDIAPPATVDGLVVEPAGEGVYLSRWNAGEPGTSFRCAVDGGPQAPCQSGLTPIRVAEGAHTFTAVAIDPSGDAGPARSVRFARVDTVLTTAPADGAHVRTPVTFAAQSGIGREFECSFDGAEYKTCGHADVAGAPVSLKLPKVREGTHTLKVRARFGEFVDVLGATRTWTLDTIAPQTTITATTGQYVSFGFTADEPGVTFYCTLDDLPFSECTPRVTGSVAPGMHTVKAYAVDRAGNADPTPATFTWSS